MSALLGMQDWNSISLHVISFGNIFLPFVFVVTLQMDRNMSGQWHGHSFSVWGILSKETKRLRSYCADGLGIEFSLKELRAVCWEVIGVHELLSRSFVRCLKGRYSNCQSWLFFSYSVGFGLMSNWPLLLQRNTFLRYPAVLCWSEPEPCSWHQWYLYVWGCWDADGNLFHLGPV